MRIEHLTFEELERHAYITGDTALARACERALNIERDALDDARSDGYAEGYEDGEEFGYENGLAEGRAERDDQPPAPPTINPGT